MLDFTTTTWFSALALLPLLYFYTAMTSTTFPSLTACRILILIAHPDDEAMFMSPTLSRLSSPSLNNRLQLLCLSSGNADGIGEIRKKELIASAKLLGIEDERDVMVLDDEKNFPDSMSVTWDSKKIADLLFRNFTQEGRAAIATEVNNKSDKGKTRTDAAAKKAPEAYIDIIVTFDKDGVSSHPNHISCHNGALAFLDILMAGKEGWACPVDVYTLTSVPIWRKYAGALDLVTTVLAVMKALGAAQFGKKKGKKEDRGRPSVLFFVSGPLEWWRGIGAMTKAHVSQMRWFRWGWIGLSRYMVVNDLRKVVR